MKCMRSLKIYILLIYCCLRSFAQICPQDPTVVELIKNGAFELANNAGNDLFESDYPGPKTSVQPDSWGIGKDPSDLDNGFASLKDHTTGNGNMMVIDADGTLQKDAYRTVVNVTANTTYFFSAWFVNVGSTTKANPVLRFTVGTTVVGASINVSATSRQWQQFYGTWFSGATSGNVTIRIENMVPTTDGNDMAIDDISFSSSCTKIQDKSRYGKSSVLPDSLFLCEIALPVHLNPGLNATEHTFNWAAAPSTSASTATFDIATVLNYTKLVMCYDSIDDGIVCYKKDSVVIVKDLRVKLGPDRAVCEPIGESFIATPNITGAAYAWERNTVAVGSNSTTHGTTQEGTYKVTVTKAGCTPASDEVVVAKIAAPLPSKGLYCNNVSPEEAFFTLNAANRINNSLNIKWFNDAVAGTEITSTKLNDSTLKVTTGTYTSIPNCARALWAQDMNAFKTTLTQNLNAADEVKKSSSDIRQKIVVKSAKLTLDSLSFYIDNNSSSTGTTPYQITIYAGNVANNTLGTVVYTSSVYNFNKVPDPVLKTIPLNVTLNGSATGMYYWILITGEIGYYDNAPSFPHNNTGTTVLSIIESYRENQTRASETGFIQNIQATAGKTSACGRVLVCADALNCTLPLHFTAFTVEKKNDEIHLSWGFAQVAKVQSLVQLSRDGIHFEDLSELQSNTFYSMSATTLSEFDILYFRIKTIDAKGAPYYSQVRSLRMESEDISVFPNPSTADFEIRSSLSGKYEISNLGGQLVECGDFESNFKTRIQLMAGVYLLKINTLESNYTFKIIKK